jgi:alkanesulfonate monooxygenase SsuD/methylene tetrahydromethanopterin reductase-like flavin-dependent oxidoreductase (luciferase family)
MEVEMNFGEALNFLKADFKVSRALWNGKGQYLKLQVPDKYSKMQKPYIYIRPVDGEYVPWVASQTDILANDWYEVVDV